MIEIVTNIIAITASLLALVYSISATKDLKDSLKSQKTSARNEIINNSISVKLDGHSEAYHATQLHIDSIVLRREDKNDG